MFRYVILAKNELERCLYDVENKKKQMLMQPYNTLEQNASILIRSAVILKIIKIKKTYMATIKEYLKAKYSPDKIINKTKIIKIKIQKLLI